MVVSIPGASPYSGWPAAGECNWRNRLMSSMVMPGTPVRYSSEYSSMQPCPAESTNRSRSGQCGSAASNLRKRDHSAVAASAMPIGRPGWPDFAFSTASMASARMASAMRRSGVIGRARIAACAASAGFSVGSSPVDAMFPPGAETLLVSTSEVRQEQGGRRPLAPARTSCEFPPPRRGKASGRPARGKDGEAELTDLRSHLSAAWFLVAAVLALSACRLVDQRTFERAPTGPSAAALAQPERPKKPILTITFSNPDDDWRPSVHAAVRAAMAHQPDVHFQVMTPVPTSASRDIQDGFVKVGRTDGPMVALEVQAAGAAPDHVTVGLLGDAGSPTREVLIFVQ